MSRLRLVLLIVPVFVVCSGFARAQQTAMDLDGRTAVQQFHKPLERAFTKSQRDQTTILFGGLTWKHEKLIHGALEGLGYKCEAVPVPNKRAFQLGKEYGNNGQCNPTYFTVGNLVQFAQSLEEKGLTKQEIIDRYVFFTAGACGPCRFGIMRPSIAWRYATRVLTASACCCFRNRAG